MYPSASPRVTLDAGPALHVYANYLTGLQECDVTNSVKPAIIIPETSPTIEQRYGTHGPKI